MTGRPRCSASVTFLPSPKRSSSKAGGGWPSSGMSCRSNSSSSRTWSLSAAGEADAPKTSATIARPMHTPRVVMRATLPEPRSRLDVRVAELLQLHHARHAARHGGQALQQLAQLDLLALERDLAGVDPEPARHQLLQLAAHLGVEILGQEGLERRPMHDQLERLDVLPAN